MSNITSKTAPVCMQCKGQSVVVNAGEFTPILYYYCRKCKWEVDRYGLEVKYRAPEEFGIPYDNDNFPLESPIYDNDGVDRRDYNDLVKDRAKKKAKDDMDFWGY